MLIKISHTKRLERQVKLFTILLLLNMGMYRVVWPYSHSTILVNLSCHLHSNPTSRYVIFSALLPIRKVNRNDITVKKIPVALLVRLQWISIHESNCIRQSYFFQNQIQRLPKAVGPFPSTTRVLYIIVFREYALPLELHIFHLYYFAQLCFFLAMIKNVVVTFRHNPNFALLGSDSNKNDPRFPHWLCSKSLWPVFGGWALLVVRKRPHFLYINILCE